MSIGVPGGGGAEPTTQRVREALPYDFRRPATLARDHARTLELAFETFARQWGTQLTARVRVMSHVTLQSVAMQTYDEYVADLPPTTAMFLCEVPGHEPKGVLQFPAAAALNWVSHMLGSPSAVDVPERKFTRIEQTLVRGLVDEALEDLHYSLGGLLQGRVPVEGIHYNAQFAQAAATSDLMVTASFSLRVGERTVQATLALPAECLLPQLGDSAAATTAEEAAERLRAHIGGIPIDVALSMEPATVTPGAILDLAVGDVLPLPHPAHRPFELTIAGRRIGRAAAGTRGGRAAAVVVSTEESTA